MFLGTSTTILYERKGLLVPALCKPFPDSNKIKVETSSFSSGTSVDVMLRKAEELFAARFGTHFILRSMA